MDELCASINDLKRNYARPYNNYDEGCHEENDEKRDKINTIRDYVVSYRLGKHRCERLVNDVLAWVNKFDMGTSQHLQEVVCRTGKFLQLFEKNMKPKLQAMEDEKSRQNARGNVSTVCADPCASERTPRDVENENNDRSTPSGDNRVPELATGQAEESREPLLAGILKLCGDLRDSVRHAAYDFHSALTECAQPLRKAGTLREQGVKLRIEAAQMGQELCKSVFQVTRYLERQSHDDDDDNDYDEIVTRWKEIVVFCYIREFAYRACIRFLREFCFMLHELRLYEAKRISDDAKDCSQKPEAKDCRKEPEAMEYPKKPEAKDCRKEPAAKNIEPEAKECSQKPETSDSPKETEANVYCQAICQKPDTKKRRKSTESKNAEAKSTEDKSTEAKISEAKSAEVKSAEAKIAEVKDFCQNTTEVKNPCIAILKLTAAFARDILLQCAHFEQSLQNLYEDKYGLIAANERALSQSTVAATGDDPLQKERNLSIAI